MAYDFNGTSQQLSAASSLTAAPITLAAWVNSDSLAGLRYIITLDQSSVANNWFALGTVATTGLVRAITVAEGNPTSAESTSGITIGTWAHCCAVFSSSTNRTAYLNGGNSATDTTSRTPSGINSTRIAARTFNGVQGLFFDGKIAEVGIWSAALTAAEITSLARGMTCDKVRPQSLVFYAPLVRDLIDAKGGLTITNNNSATVAAHPRVYA